MATSTSATDSSSCGFCDGTIAGGKCWDWTEDQDEPDVDEVSATTSMSLRVGDEDVVDDMTLGAEAKWGSPGFTQMGRSKAKVVARLLRMNVTLFFADADVVCRGCRAHRLWLHRHRYVLIRRQVLLQLGRASLLLQYLLGTAAPFRQVRLRARPDCQRLSQLRPLC